MAKNDGAFQHGEGRAPGTKGKERAREPDHRMWACRIVALKEGKNGTDGEGDYQLLEATNDDGEQYGGNTVLKAMQECRGVDVLTVCCRWYGGDMIGPARFQHISLTSRHSLEALLKLQTLTTLRTSLTSLDNEIASLRDTINPPGSPLLSVDPGTDANEPKQTQKGLYDEVEDIPKLERLVKARERTKALLESKVGWIGLEQNRAEDTASG
ncbi:hypothetical protein P7C73_g6333, partial [Tremellales sp. Uapishka_1]